MNDRIPIIISILLILVVSLSAQDKPYRIGTTAANFLEMGIGGAGNAMGEAYVSVVNDISSVYWNPAGLAYIQNNEALFMHQPWIAGIDVNFAGAGFSFPSLGTFAFAITNMNYGRTEVTTMLMQEGTGETYEADEYAFMFSYGRKIVQWFAFGATAKYVTSRIWHMSAGAAALDLGVTIDTQFFSPTGRKENGLRIGMSISNYGTRMKYDGIDLLQPIDILPDENGNYEYVEGEYRLQGWELPLIFRIGTSLTPLVTETQKLTLAIDALHPNNNSESVNVGGEYQYSFTGLGKLMLWGGYRGLFMEENPYGVTMGVGLQVDLVHNSKIKIGYAYKNMEILTNSSIYTLAVTF
jgi:hypothetical protein